MSEDANLDRLHAQTRIGRRPLLQGASLGAIGLAAAALIGCGSDDDGGDSTPAAGTAAPTGSAVVSAGPGRLIQGDGLPYPYQYPDPPGAPKPGGHFRFSTTYDVSIFDPAKSPAGGTIQATNMVYNRLIGIKNGLEADPFKFELKPELASSWERSPDGLTFTFKITPNVKWQNVAPLSGRAFGASDVKFAYDRYKAGGQGTAYFANVDAISAPDEGTLKISLKKPTADFLNSLGGRYLTVFPHELVDDGTIEKRLIGTGPMLFKEAQQGTSIQYAKNPDYFRAKVLVDTAEHRIIPDASARLAAFRAGQTETGYSIVGSLSDTKNLLGTNPKTQVQQGASLYCGFTFALNLALPKYQDERVRQAISMGIDRKFIIQTLYEGLGRQIPALPWVFVLDKEPTEADLGPYWQYNPTEAKKLLGAAGVPNLEINSSYFAYSSTNTRVSEILTDGFRASGITLKDRSADYTEFNSQWTTRKLPEATSSGWESLGYDADNFFYNHLHSTSPGNRWNINDPQLDTWAEQQQVELDPQKRKAIHKKIWDYDLQKVLRVGEPTAIAFSVLQPWVRYLRTGPSMAGSVISYDDGAMIENTWMDK